LIRVSEWWSILMILVGGFNPSEND
jgi:hypothetical protein